MNQSPLCIRKDYNRASWLDILNAPSSPDQEEAWDTTEQIIFQSASEVQKSGDKFVLVIVADSLQITFDGGEEDVFGKRRDLSYPNKRLTKFCKQHRINCLNSLPFFLEWRKDLPPLLSLTEAMGTMVNLGILQWQSFYCRHCFLKVERILPNKTPLQRSLAAELGV